MNTARVGDLQPERRAKFIEVLKREGFVIDGSRIMVTPTLAETLAELLKHSDAFKPQRDTLVGLATETEYFRANILLPLDYVWARIGELYEESAH